MSKRNEFQRAVERLSLLNTGSTNTPNFLNAFVGVENSLAALKQSEEFIQYKKFDSVFSRIQSTCKAAITAITDCKRKTASITSQMSQVFSRISSIKDITSLPEYREFRPYLNVFIAHYPIGVAIQELDSVSKKARIVVSRLKLQSQKQLFDIIIQLSQDLKKEMSSIRTRLATYKSSVESQASTILK